MTVVKYSPFSLASRLQNELNTLMQHSGAQSSDDNSMVETSQWVPAVDVKEEAERFVLLADLPGIDPKDVDISVEKGILTIKGERYSENKEELDNYTRVERSSGVFYRRFSLPDTADLEHISAKSKHGVYEIIIPKQEVAQSRRIDVQVHE